MDSSRGGTHFRSGCLVASDAIALFVAWPTAVALASAVGRSEPGMWFPPSSTGGAVYSLMAVLVLLALAFGGDYGRRAAFWEETRVIWKNVALAGLVNFALNFFVQVTYTRTVLVLAWLLALVLLPLGRLACREVLISQGRWRRRALVVGDDEKVLEAVRAIRRERHLGLEVTAVLPTSAHGQTALVDPVRNLGLPMVAAGADIEETASRHGCDALIVVLNDRLQAQASGVVARLHAARFEIFVVPELQGLPVQGMQPQYFFSNDVLFLRLQHRLFSRSAHWAKRTMDILLAGAALAVLSPLMAWVAWRIRREDGGPVFFSQRRVGQAGEEFEFFKFRSMVMDADAVLAGWERTDPDLYQRYVDGNFKLPDDPRVLQVGSLIRRTSIDELPQLWNVLRGDMSLVGPRPLLPRELPSYSSEVFELYAQVRPGVTGLWQVSGRSDTTFAQRASMDGWYVRNWSLWVDVVILLKTVRVVLSARGAA